MSISRKQRIIFLSMAIVLLLQFIPSLDLSNGISLGYSTAQAGPHGPYSSGSVSGAGEDSEAPCNVLADEGNVRSNQITEFPHKHVRYISWWQKSCIKVANNRMRWNWDGWYTWVNTSEQRHPLDLALDSQIIWNPTANGTEGDPLHISVLPRNTDITLFKQYKQGNQLVIKLVQEGSSPRCSPYFDYTEIRNNEIQWKSQPNWVQYCW